MLREQPRDVTAIVVTDGVFSMEGDLAPLSQLVVCRTHEALLVVDDSHGTGVVGPTGRGTADHFALLGQVDVVTGTLGKALGGAVGGFAAARVDLVQLLRGRSRPYIFSNPIAPSVAFGAKPAVGKVLAEPWRVARLRAVTEVVRTEAATLGLEVPLGESAIVALVVGDEARTARLSDELLDRGSLVTAFTYPVVPRGAARIRVQLSAAVTDADVEQALDAVRAWVAAVRAA